MKTIFSFLLVFASLFSIAQNVFLRGAPDLPRVPEQPYPNEILYTSTTAFCEKGDPGLISGNTPLHGGCGLPYTYTWEQSNDGITYSLIAGANSQSYDPVLLSQTTYIRRGVDGGCNSIYYSNVIKFTIYLPPIANAGQTEVICPGLGIGVGKGRQIGGNPTGSGSGSSYTYEWSPVTGLDNPASANPFANPTSNFTYIVTVTSSFTGCTASSSVSVVVNPTFTGR